MSRVAVLTVLPPQHAPPAAQQQALATSTRPPDLVVVATQAPAVDGVPAGAPLPTQVLDAGAPRPLGAARNAAVACALTEGADLLVMLDPDCLVCPEALARLETAAGRVPKSRPAVLVAPVHRLPPLPAGRTSYDEAELAAAPPHPDLPLPPPDGQLRRESDLRMLRSTSWAIRATDWQRVGGFDEGYRGHGSEELDFAQRLAGAGGRLWWVGGATAYHRDPVPSDPPLARLDDVLSNANRFKACWGWFPMEPWLAAFAERGLAHHDPVQDRWVAGPQPGKGKATTTTARTEDG